MALICCFYCVFVRFFTPFCDAWGLAAQRWLGGELGAFSDAYFYCALLVGNCTQLGLALILGGRRVLVLVGTGFTRNVMRSTFNVDWTIR